MLLLKKPSKPNGKNGALKIKENSKGRQTWNENNSYRLFWMSNFLRNITFDYIADTSLNRTTTLKSARQRRSSDQKLKFSILIIILSASWIYWDNHKFWIRTIYTSWINQIKYYLHNFRNYSIQQSDIGFIWMSIVLSLTMIRHISKMFHNSNWCLFNQNRFEFSTYNTDRAEAS